MLVQGFEFRQHRGSIGPKSRRFTLLEWTGRFTRGLLLSSRDLGTQGRALLRVAGRKSGQNRWIRAFYNAGNVTLRNVSRVLHVLWLEVAGLFFLVLAVVGAAAAVREFHRHSLGAGSTGKILLASMFALLFGYFGVSSFWRSRRR
jgi:hypothetical protein